MLGRMGDILKHTERVRAGRWVACVGRASKSGLARGDLRAERHKSGE